jgi:antitoxin component of MazEF toxin-antitoxin module
MHTVRLNVTDSVYEKVMSALGTFSKDDVEIFLENDQFLIDQKYIEDELQEMENGNAQYMTMEEVNKHLENKINYKF